MLDILYEDNHCIAVNKPARMLTAGDRTGDESLLEQVRAYLKEKYRKPGNAFVGLVHRLDRPVSGVVLFARTSKAAARLSQQFRQSSIEKTYQAIIERNVAETKGEFTDSLVKDETTNVVRSVPAGMPSARISRLRFRRLRRARNLTLLEITPETGRSHQIRVQLASRGYPIYGDKKYGSKHGFRGAIALHAASLTFNHPTRRESVTISAPVPATWEDLLSD